MNWLLATHQRRSLFISAVVLLILLLCVVLAEAQPKAVLSQADMGAFTVIRTDGSEGAMLDLFAVPDTAPFVRFNDYVLGPDGKPQLRPVGIVPNGASLTVVLIAAGCKEETVLLARETLAIGGKPGPPPGPPEPPDPPDPPKTGVSLLMLGSTTCVPCKTMGPILEQVKAAGHQVSRIDVDQDKDAMAKWKPIVLPTLVMLVDGERVADTTGVMSAAQIQKWMAETEAWAKSRKAVPR